MSLFYPIYYHQFNANGEAHSFEELKQKTEQQIAKQQEIERLTKLINQKSLSLRDKVELAKRIKR